MGDATVSKDPALTEPTFLPVGESMTKTSEENVERGVIHAVNKNEDGKGAREKRVSDGGTIQAETRLR